MRSTPFGRVHLGVATLAVVALVGTVLARSAPASPLPTPAEPQFLAWQGEPYTDDINHYVIALQEDEPASGWLQVSEDRLVASAVPPRQVAPGEINDAIAGAETIQEPEQAAATIRQMPGIASIHPIAFGMYAIAGSVTAADLAAVPGVASVAVDVGIEAATVDPYFPTQWGLDNDGETSDPWPVTADADIDAPEGWHRTRGQGVVVAVVDSGADITHPDLVANIWRNPGEQCGNGVDDDANGYVDDCSGWDFANNSPNLTDHIGHGTHISGIIAAAADNGIGVAGVAYEAEVMVLKIGDGTPALSAAIEAIAYAIDNGARVINASWVVDDPAAGVFLDTAIAAAGDAGILVVAAAGNEPQDVDVTPRFPAASTLDNVITVAASTPVDQPADWSAYGAAGVDLFAPGEHIISTIPGGYGIYSGTSMAAPMVSGAAALLWAATPEATVAEVKGALLDRSDGPNDGVTAFHGLATSDGRLNINRSIYSAPLFQPSLMFDFHEFNSFEPSVAHKVAITAKTVDPWIVPPQTPAMYRAGLYVPVDGQPMAVVGLDLTYTGGDGDLTVATDETGRALVGRPFEPQQRPAFVQDGDLTPLAMELPAGTYAFVMEIVDITNPDQPVTLGDPAAVFFIVTDDGSVAEMPQIPIGGNPAPNTSTTGAPITAGPQPTTPAGSTTTAATATTLDEPVATTIPASTTTTSLAVTTTTGAPPPTTPPQQSTTTSQPSPPPTTAAATTTTAPGLPATTTTVPAVVSSTTTTSPPLPTTTTTQPSGMKITGVNPAQGPVAGGTLVTITGSQLPENPDVLFGEQGAEVVSVIAPTFIIVDTPSGNAGWTDITVVDRATGAMTTLRNGFLYVENGDEPPPPPPPTTSSTTTSSLAPPTSFAPTTLPGTTTPTTVSTTTQPLSVPDLFDDWRDSMLRTPEGLQLAPPAPDDPINMIPVDLWIGALCDQPVCPGWVLEG